MESSKQILTPGAENKNIKYTFSGTAPNLIDKFLVLGYDQKTIDFTYQNCNVSQSPDLNTRFSFFEFDNRPTIVNEICNDYKKDLLEDDLVLELIFPNFPQMYFLDKQYINTEKEIDEDILISSYSIIFSINPQDNSGSKKSYNGLGFVFFLIQEHRSQGEIDGYLYIPNAYVILSEYPYFYHFNEICKNIFLQMKRENDEIPIDILIYNLVKFAPSPINKSINLLFGAPIGFHQNKTNSKVENILTSLKSNSQKDYNGIPSIFFNQLSGYPFMDINMSFLLNLIPPEIIVEVFIFSFLESDIIFYSFMPEILNMVMYIFANLNYPFNESIYYWHVLSVSQDSFMTGKSTFVGKTSSTLTGILSKYDPELLTTKKIREHFVLDIDNKNFFYIYQEETKEVTDVMTLFSYIKSCVEDISDTNDLKKIDKAPNKTYFEDGFQLYEVIRNLMAELIRRSKKVTSTNYNEKKIRPSFLNMYDDESEMDCMEINMRFQKAFFTFITQLVKNCLGTFNKGEEDKNKDNESFSSNRIPSIENSKKEENGFQEEGEEGEGEVEVQKKELAKKAGKIFREKFIESSKYNSFIINFCQYHETIDLYEIPYSFINEFIYYSQIASKNNLSEVGVFQLIDQFYGKIKMLDFEEIISQKEKDKEMEKSKKNEKDDKKDKKEKDKKEKEKKKEKKKDKKNENKIEQKDDKANKNDNLAMNEVKEEDTELENIYLFSFDNFTDYYQNNLRAIINREQEDDRDIFIKVKSSNRNYKKYKRSGTFLSNKILNTYMTFVNNNFDKIIELFKLIKCEYANPNPNQGIEVKKPEEVSKEVSPSEHIDYTYLLKNRNMDKSLWNYKFFGTYDFLEITDVIEHHFILERCFSSYGIIKFCLLNVLAVTRTIGSELIDNQFIIDVIIEFCKQTKSLVRKYMNIYLNIFHSLQRNLNETQREQFEINDCINLISTYIKKSNVIPSKELLDTLSENQSESTSNKSSLSKSSTNDDNKREFFKKNGKFFELKQGFLHRNTREKFNEILKAIESIFTGKFNSFILSIDYKEVSELYSLISKKGKFCPKTPVSLYVSTNKILRSYMKNFSLDSKYYDELCIDILSLLYYMKIPTIGGKWIDCNKEKEKEKEKKENLVRSFIKEKSLKKKDTNKEEDGQHSAGSSSWVRTSSLTSTRRVRASVR